MHTAYRLGLRALKSNKQETFWDMSLPAFGVRVGKASQQQLMVMVGRDRKRRTIGIYPDINLQEARAKAKRIDALLLNSVSGVVDEGHIGRLHFRVECRVEFVENRLLVSPRAAGWR